MSNDHAFKALEQDRHGQFDHRVVAHIVFISLATSPRRVERRAGVVHGKSSGISARLRRTSRADGLLIEELLSPRTKTTCSTSFSAPIYRVRTAAETYHDQSEHGYLESVEFRGFVLICSAAIRRVLQLFRDAEGGVTTAGSGDFARVQEFGFVSGRSSHATGGHHSRRVSLRHHDDTHTVDGLKLTRNLKPCTNDRAETAQPSLWRNHPRSVEREPERSAALIDQELPQKLISWRRIREGYKAFIAGRIWIRRFPARRWRFFCGAFEPSNCALERAALRARRNSSQNC